MEEPIWVMGIKGVADLDGNVPHPVLNGVAHLMGGDPQGPTEVEL